MDYMVIEMLVHKNADMCTLLMNMLATNGKDRAQYGRTQKLCMTHILTKAMELSVVVPALSDEGEVEWSEMRGLASPGRVNVHCPLDKSKIIQKTSIWACL